MIQRSATIIQISQTEDTSVGQEVGQDGRQTDNGEGPIVLDYTAYLTTPQWRW